MSGFDREIRDVANCPHTMALRLGAAERCPHCGAIRLLNGSWALPHLVDVLVRAHKAANGESDKLDRRLKRLLQRLSPGQRVRAVETIVYGTGEEVAEGTIGEIQRTGVHGCTPLVTVCWGGRGGNGQPLHIDHPCSVESLEPVP